MDDIMADSRARRFCSFHRRRPRGMTLIEVTLALGVLAVAVGCLVEILASVSIGHERLRNRQAGVQAARNVAERVIQCNGDWRALCAEFEAMPDVAVSVQDGDGDPASGWAKITVRVDVPSLRGGPAEQIALVFGRTAD